MASGVPGGERMPKRASLLRYFKCSWCGAIATAPRTHGKTHAGHIKTMWCYVCKRERDFVQIDQEKTR